MEGVRRAAGKEKARGRAREVVKVMEKDLSQARKERIREAFRRSCRLKSAARKYYRLIFYQNVEEKFDEQNFRAL